MTLDETTIALSIDLDWYPDAIVSERLERLQRLAWSSVALTLASMDPASDAMATPPELAPVP